MSETRIWERLAELGGWLDSGWTRAPPHRAVLRRFGVCVCVYASGFISRRHQLCAQGVENDTDRVFFFRVRRIIQIELYPEMAEGTYEYECARAELLGVAPPNREDFDAAAELARKDNENEALLVRWRLEVAI